MTTLLNKRDQSLLLWLAEYRVLSTSQIALLNEKNTRSIRRQMKNLLDLNFVESIQRSFTGARGRPEGLFCLSQKGVDLLHENRMFDPLISLERIQWKGWQSLEHQIGVNWVLIHTKVLERSTHLKVNHISHTSPIYPDCKSSEPFIHDTVLFKDGLKQIGFTPDAVLVIEDTSQNKSLLFFLEFDRATESLVGSKSNSILQKIRNYQAYFQQGGYKRYEKVFNCCFKGFRLLFVSESKHRYLNLCRLVSDHTPSGFIWLTQLENIQTKGIGSRIWTRGGNLNEPPESVLGSNLAFGLVETFP